MPQKDAVDSVVSLLGSDGAHEELHSCLPPNSVKPANHTHDVRGQSIQSKSALLLW